MQSVLPEQTEAAGSGTRLSLTKLLQRVSFRQFLPAEIGVGQVCVWAAIILVGLAQAWNARHLIFSDGLAYLDIASYYARGDWHDALNSYWSPLYSWLIALVLVVVRPSPYWHVSVLHAINFGGYVCSLISLELLMADLIRYQRRKLGDEGLSETTIRAVGYSVFLIACLLLINLGYVSPDLIAMALQFYLLHCLMRAEAGSATTFTYASFGVALGLSFLCRAAFLPFIPFMVLLLIAVCWDRRTTVMKKPLAIVVGATVLIVAPYVTAISKAKGSLTFGEAGKLNYGWEVDGAARWVHWQGEPGDIGKPIHPTKKVLDNPPVFTFASPVPGTYPPWYNPAYWYDGIRPTFKIQSQLRVLFADLKLATYLLVRSPVVLPVLLLALVMGIRRWLSPSGITAYWFVLLQPLLLILAYALVFIDARYIASSLVVIWLCLICSVGVPDARIRRRSDTIIRDFSLVFAVFILASRMESPIRTSMGDLLRRHEAEWNLNWMIADRLTQLGVQPTDKVAWIGQGIDSEWARIDKLKIVAEVPPTYERDNTWSRRIDWGLRKRVNTFWYANAEQRKKVFDAFRNAGATIVVAEKVPPGVDTSGWVRLLPEQLPHFLVVGGGQSGYYRRLRFRRIAPAPPLETSR